MKKILLLLITIIFLTNCNSDSVLEKIKKTCYYKASPDNKAIIYQTSYNNGQNTVISLSTWVNQNENYGGGGILDIKYSKPITLEIMWLNDSIVNITIPKNAKVIRKEKSSFFLGRKTLFEYTLENKRAMKSNNLFEISSKIYETPENWEKRGLNISDDKTIQILTKSTNDFLKKLSDINESELSNEVKLKEINKIVDNLPWSDLDTEEKEFLADVLAPAIEKCGFNPWEIF